MNYATTSTSNNRVTSRSWPHLYQH